MKPKKKLKLYVWTGFAPDYTDGLAFAIASSEKDARKQIEVDAGTKVSTWGTLTVRPLSRRFSGSVWGGG
jgi:hypothetical protein